jgi:DNA-binding transcriptional regulator YiaG
MPAAWRFEHLIPIAGTAGMGGGITIAPDGRVYPDLRTTDPGPQGQPATFVRHLDVLDEMLAMFLRHRGHGHRLVPVAAADLASPRTEAARVVTPRVVKDWFAAEVAAGRIIPAEHLPPPAVRRQLRESAGLSRPEVAARLGVSGEALRLWEEGLREPQGDNRAPYLSLLTSWQSVPQEPAEETRNPSLWRCRGAIRSVIQASNPTRGPLTNPSHRESYAAAVRAHKARMARIHGRPA